MDLQTELSLSLIVWSTNSLVFLGTLSLTFCAAGGPNTVDFSSKFAVLFSILTSRPPPGERGWKEPMKQRNNCDFIYHNGACSNVSNSCFSTRFQGIVKHTFRCHDKRTVLSAKAPKLQPCDHIRCGHHIHQILVSVHMHLTVGQCHYDCLVTLLLVVHQLHGCYAAWQFDCPQFLALCGDSDIINNNNNNNNNNNITFLMLHQHI